MPLQTSIGQIGEFGLIERIKKIVEINVNDSTVQDDLVMGIADDSAVYRPSSSKLQLFTTDTMVEGIHFDLTFTSFAHLGWKAIVSNISDVAAMCGLPRYALVSISMPQKISVEMIEEFYKGAVSACKKYSCLIVGGDTTAIAGNMVVSISMIGEVEPEKVIYRNTAKTGDLICVTGHLGGAHAGLKVLLREKNRYLEKSEKFLPSLEPYKPAIEKYLYPKPRLDISKIISDGIRVNAMIDISDGLASEVHHICNNSDMGAEIWEHNIPVHTSSQKIAGEFSENVINYALHGGEEYELLFTLADKEFEKLENFTADVTILGRIVDKSKGINIVRENGEKELLQFEGWDHFKNKTK
jgi:thiamine-monophosphate kinase